MDYKNASAYEIEVQIIELFTEQFDVINGEVGMWQGRSEDFRSGALLCWRELLTRIIGDISGGEEQ